MMSSYNLLLLPVVSYVAHITAAGAGTADAAAVRQDLDHLFSEADAAGSKLPDYAVARMAVASWTAEKLPWYRPMEFERGRPQDNAFFTKLDTLLSRKGRREVIAVFLTVLRLGYAGPCFPEDPLLHAYRLRCESRLACGAAGYSERVGGSSAGRRRYGGVWWWIVPSIVAITVYCLCRVHLDALYQGLLG